MYRGKVLVIDDEERILSLLELYLVQHDYTVIRAESGAAGLKAIKKHRPDIVILDIQLPDLDGLEVCRQIRQKYQIPILYLSCYQDSNTIVTGLELGGDDYMTKPFDPNVLVARVNALLRRIRGKDWRGDEPDVLIEPLTEQEFQILHWMEKGYTNKEIADKLNLKEGTIKVYNSVLYQKLQVRNRTQAIVRAKEAKLI